MFEAVKGAYMSVYTPAQKDISTDHVNYECIKNCVLSFLQPENRCICPLDFLKRLNMLIFFFYLDFLDF